LQLFEVIQSRAMVMMRVVDKSEGTKATKAVPGEMRVRVSEVSDGVVGA